jgi:hypothetical protein
MENFYIMFSHDYMVVNNMICETLAPTNRIAQLYRDVSNMYE